MPLRPGCGCVQENLDVTSEVRLCSFPWELLSGTITKIFKLSGCSITQISSIASVLWSLSSTPETSCGQAANFRFLLSANLNGDTMRLLCFHIFIGLNSVIHYKSYHMDLIWRLSSFITTSSAM